jgi:hypothetical protein
MLDPVDAAALKARHLAMNDFKEFHDSSSFATMREFWQGPSRFRVFGVAVFYSTTFLCSIPVCSLKFSLGLIFSHAVHGECHGEMCNSHAAAQVRGKFSHATCSRLQVSEICTILHSCDACCPSSPSCFFLCVLSNKCNFSHNYSEGKKRID